MTGQNLRKDRRAQVGSGRIGGSLWGEAARQPATIRAWPGQKAHMLRFYLQAD